MSGKGVWRAGAFTLIKETERKIRRSPQPSPMWMVTRGKCAECHHTVSAGTRGLGCFGSIAGTSHVKWVLPDMLAGCP